MLLKQVQSLSNSLLALSEPLQTAPSTMETSEFLEWSDSADRVARGLIMVIGSLREHYSTRLLKKDGTIIDRERLPGV